MIKEGACNRTAGWSAACVKQTRACPRAAVPPGAVKGGFFFLNLFPSLPKC